MDERLNVPRKRGLDRNALRLIGLAIAALGMLGTGILQNRVLGGASGDALLELLNSSSGAMDAASAAVALKAIEAVAVPIFAALTVDGFRRTASVRNYALRLTALALVSEIPYHLARAGKLWESSAHNPVIGLVIVVCMLYLVRSFPGPGAKGAAVKAVSLAAAVVWALMLNVEYGVSMVIICFVLWLLRDKPNLVYFGGCAAALLCTVGNVLFLFAPLGILPVYFYNGTQRPTSRLVQYALYPIVLLLIYAAGVVLF